MPNLFTGIKNIKAKTLEKISNITSKYYKLISFLSILFSVLGLVYSGLYLQIDADKDNLISNKKDYHQRYKKYLDEFGDKEDLIVVIKSENVEKNKIKKIIDKIVSSTQKQSDFFHHIQYKVNLGELESEAFLLLESDSFEKITQIIKNQKSELEQIYQFNNYGSFFNFISQKLSTISSSSSNQQELEPLFPILKKIIEDFDDPQKIEPLDLSSQLQKIIHPNRYVDSEGYLFSPDGKLAFVLLTPQKNYQTTKVVEKPLQFIRSTIESIKKDYPEIKLGVTGHPALQHDELKSTGQDSIWTGLGAFIGVSLLFIFFFGFHRGPLITIFSLVCGLSWSIGWITLTIGHLNLLTTVFTIILIGLGIDYGIHFLFRYQKERALGKSQTQSIQTTIHQTGGAIITGAISSAIAFLSALFTDFLGLQELGFVAGSGLIFCLMAQIITLPSFLLLTTEKKNFFPPKELSTDWYEKYFLTRPKTKIAIVLFLTLLAFPYLKEIQFEDNLLKLQDPKSDAVIYEKEIINNTEISSWTAVHISNDLEKIKTLRSQLKKLPTVKKTESILNFLPTDQDIRINKIKNLDLNLNSTNRQLNHNDLSSSLNNLNNKINQLIELAFTGGQLDAVQELENLSEIIQEKKKLLSSKKEKLKNQIKKSETIFFEKTKRIITNIDQKLHPQGINIEKIPSEIKYKFIGKNGNYVLYTYPVKNIWEKDNLEEFIYQIRKIDPLVTGSPIETYETTKRMKSGFFLVGLITLMIVLIILWFDLGNLIDCMIAMIPLLIGLLWLTLFMGYFDIRLSLGNFFALPLLMGIGIDNGIHLIHHYREKESIRELFKSILTPIFLSTLTTILGFGSLSLVSHRGLSSFGQIMTLGSLSCFLASFILVPTFLSFKKSKLKPHFLLLFIFILGFSNQAEAKKQFKFIPVPIFEQSPDEGQSYGIMPIFIGSDKGENAIKMILGNIFEYNNITNFGYAALAQIFPKEHQRIELFGLISQHHQRKFRFRFYDTYLTDKLYVDFRFIYQRSPFTRFFGIGPQTANFDESNYVASMIELDPTIGFYLSKSLRVDFTPSFHHRDVSGRAIQSIADTNSKYGHLSQVKNANNFIPEIGFVLDTRPGKDFSKKGIYSKVAYFFSHKDLGSDDTFQGWSSDIRYLFPVIKDKVFTALRFSMEKRYGTDIPFYEQSQLGGGFELRSFVPGRFTDKGKMIFQIEERIKLKSMKVMNKEFDLFVDPFFEVGRVYDGISDLGFKHWQPVGGVGFRLFVPPNVVGRLDLSMGSNGFEIYTGLGYPF